MAVYVMGGTVGTVPDKEGRPVAFRVDRTVVVNTPRSCLPVTMMGSDVKRALPYEKVAVEAIIATSYERANSLHEEIKRERALVKRDEKQGGSTVEEKVASLWNTGYSPEGIAMKLHVREGRVRHILTDLGYVGGW